MISYKPSHGNDRGTPVSLNKDIELFGESLGGPILHSLKANTKPRKTTISTELTNSSVWFFKDITDYNFINGTTFYRAIYIGADINYDESELIGTISTSITNNFSGTSAEEAKVDSSLTSKIWLEGKFNFASSVNDKGGILLDDEQDVTGLLDNAIWTDDIVYNKTLISGEYLKIWIKITSPKDTSLTGFVNYKYTLNIGNLSIPISRERGRLNYSTIYSTDLSDQNPNSVYVLNEFLPSTFEVSENVKSIKKGNKFNVFYFDTSQKLKLVSIDPDLDITKNKYIDIDLSEITGSILESQDFTYTTFSECVSGYTPSPSAVNTISTSGINDYLGKKFIIDIFSSNKDLNLFYIFYNEFVSNSTQDYNEKYGHSQYNWNTGVLKIDISHVNDSLFDTVSPGKTKNLILTDDNFNFEIKKKHYINSYILIDDLFIGVGFDVEDCRITNNRSNLTYVWEKDIIFNDLKVQEAKIPLSLRNYLNTIPNNSQEENYLIFNDLSEVDTLDTTYCREVKEFEDGTKYVQMGPPHKRSVDHGYSSITYDILQDIDSFSATWSFGINEDSNFIGSTPSSSGTSASPSLKLTSLSSITETTGSTGTTGTTGTTGIPDLTNPYYLHYLYQEDYNNYINNPYPINDPISRTYKNVFVPLFIVHCNGNEEEYAFKVDYNFFNKTWKITNKDENGDLVEETISNVSNLSLDYENVITLNTFRKQIYGCGKRYMLNYNLYINGESVIDSTTFTTDTTNSYVITHNYDNFFPGNISFFEVRDGLQEEGFYYAQTMYQILSNLSWPLLENEFRNTAGPSGLEFFTYTRNILINNLNWENPDDFLYPIVLQGNAYNVGEEYNTEVSRSIFDFNKINVNNPSFTFTFENTSNEIDWVAGPYDFNNDTMVIWLKLKDWRGQKITMFYGDIRIIKDQKINKVYDGYYGVWTMEKFKKENQIRYEKTDIYNVGEGIVLAENNNGSFLVQLDKQYFYGIKTLYGSNKFDIKYDDRFVHRNREENVENFIDDSISLFKPADMELRNLSGIYPLKLESNNSEDC